MIFDLITYVLLASIFVVNTLRMFFEKPKNAMQPALLPWQRLLGRRSDAGSKTSGF